MFELRAHLTKQIVGFKKTEENILFYASALVRMVSG